MEHPFSMAYVLSITDKHQIRAIDISIEKTQRRLADVGPEDRIQLFNTLSVLEEKRKMVVDYRLHNAGIYGDTPREY